MTYLTYPKEIARQTQTPGEHNQRIDLLGQLKLTHKKIIESKLISRVETKNHKLKSKNSIWDTVKLIKRFNKPNYSSLQSKIDLLTFDANHHAKEMALVEPITRFSYIHKVEINETLGDGYSEDITLMLNSFAQDLATNGLSSSRAVVESLSFQKAKALLTEFAINGKDDAVLITSFPDDTHSGYHGVDSKNNWDVPETHHSFFYLLRVGEINMDEYNSVVSFEIKTTQYRDWPNARQAIDIHQRLRSPINEFDAPIPNLLFSNLIQLNQLDLDKITADLEILYDSNFGPLDNDEDHFEETFKKILYFKSKDHIVNHTQLPEIDLDEFWHIQKEYFNHFYLKVALPIFDEISLLQNQKMNAKTFKLIQEKIDFLDKAFFYYSKILMGWIKINNTNQNYSDTFKEKNKLKSLIDFQQKVLIRLMGQKQSNNLPDVITLTQALDIDHRLATNQKVSNSEKKKLLNVWSFFTFVGRFNSLLQCGTVAQFKAPFTLMKRANYLSSAPSGNVIPEFSSSLKKINVPDKKELLKAFQNEQYVELDLTDAKPVPANKIYSVPKSYLEGEGCVVDENGDVLGPCIETIIENGTETKKRIKLDDPRDTMAFAMPLFEFNKFILKIQESIEKSSISELGNIFNESSFSDQDKRKAQIAIKRIKQILIKKSLGLQEFITGDVTNNEFSSNNKWLQDLIIKLSFSLNPVETLIQEVEQKMKDKDPLIDEVTSYKN